MGHGFSQMSTDKGIHVYGDDPEAVAVSIYLYLPVPYFAHENFGQLNRFISL